MVRWLGLRHCQFISPRQLGRPMSVYRSHILENLHTLSHRRIVLSSSSPSQVLVQQLRRSVAPSCASHSKASHHIVYVQSPVLSFHRISVEPLILWQSLCAYFTQRRTNAPPTWPAVSVGKWRCPPSHASPVVACLKQHRTAADSIKSSSQYGMSIPTTRSSGPSTTLKIASYVYEGFLTAPL
jgi:hypothetical protein